MKEKVKVIVPFDEEGKEQLTEYDFYRKHPCNGVYLRDNYSFAATLSYINFTRGRSALNIVWKGVGYKFKSGMSMLQEVLTGDVPPNFFVRVEEGVLTLTGKFTFKKQGTSILLIIDRN